MWEKEPLSNVPDVITLYSGETVYHEAAYIGATIRHLMMNEGYQYQDFAIIARSLGPLPRRTGCCVGTI